MLAVLLVCARPAEADWQPLTYHPIEKQLLPWDQYWDGDYEGIVYLSGSGTSSLRGDISYRFETYLATATVQGGRSSTDPSLRIDMATMSLQGGFSWAGSTPAPSHLNLLLTTRARAEAGAVGSSMYGSASASVGDVSASASATGVNAIQWISDVQAQRRKRLIRVPTSGGRAVVTLEASGMAWANHSEPPGNDLLIARGYSEVDASIELDNRSVALQRLGQPRGETYDIRTNTTYGHTTRSYPYREDTGEGIFWFNRFNWQQFTTRFSGDWTYGWFTDPPIIWQQTYRPDVSWSWSPDNDRDNRWNYGRFSMPMGEQWRDENGDWQGASDDPITYNITYTATDNRDGATATANYVLTVHDHYEEKTYRWEDRFENWRQCSRDLVGPGHFTASESVEIAYSLSTDVGGPVGKWIASMLGIDVNLSATKNYVSTSGVEVEVPQGQYTYMEMGDHYYYHIGTADVWDEDGHVAEEAFTIREVPANEHDRTGIRLHRPFKEHNP